MAAEDVRSPRTRRHRQLARLTFFEGETAAAAAVLSPSLRPSRFLVPDSGENHEHARARAPLPRRRCFPRDERARGICVLPAQEFAPRYRITSLGRRAIIA